MHDRHVAIVGAGIVGISTALALRDRGFSVTVFDPHVPGSRTSTWNAGVLATSSLAPLCNPTIFGRLPSLALGRHPGFSMDWSAAIPNAGWLMRFLASSRSRVFEQSAAALNALIGYSRRCHEALLDRAGARHLLREAGWLILHRDAASPAAAERGFSLYRRFGVDVEVVSGKQVHELEPALRRSYAGGLLFPGTAAIIDPRTLVGAYARLMVESGVTFVSKRVDMLQPHAKGGVRLITSVRAMRFDDVVVTAGAWSADLLRPYGRLPIAVERGYLMKYRLNGEALARPIYDVEAGLVLSPRPEGVQLSTGTDLTRLNSRPRLRQFNAAEAEARSILDLGAPVMAGPAIGNRPSLPDGLPAIGRIARVPGLWVATGHQHIGFSTGPATGRIMADLMSGVKPVIDAVPFAPARFGL